MERRRATEYRVQVFLIQGSDGLRNETGAVHKNGDLAGGGSEGGGWSDRGDVRNRTLSRRHNKGEGDLGLVRGRERAAARLRRGDAEIKSLGCRKLGSRESRGQGIRILEKSQQAARSSGRRSCDSHGGALHKIVAGNGDGDLRTVLLGSGRGDGLQGGWREINGLVAAGRQDEYGDNENAERKG